MTMNKVLVKLFVPIIGKEYDIWMPINKKIYKITNLLIKSVNELCGGYYTPSKTTMLYEKSTGKQYDMNLNAKENNIKNGAEIILI